ncbi:hypothetical protein AVEN_90045-1 [Araneus ventricosus]|uniref:Uncharacterized protein n=1 Tax=Araneus ventricosus TaxID=182803 RepID=A0A4Y2T797_ARAVE|nr:hypothetical protein AVEN_90045-1 [Araneus ventricosus]
MYQYAKKNTLLRLPHYAGLSERAVRRLTAGDYSLCCFKSHNSYHLFAKSDTYYRLTTIIFTESNTRREEKTVPNKLIIKHVPPLSKIETDIKTMVQGVAKTHRSQ